MLKYLLTCTLTYPNGKKITDMVIFDNQEEAEERFILIAGKQTKILEESVNV